MHESVKVSYNHNQRRAKYRLTSNTVKWIPMNITCLIYDE